MARQSKDSIIIKDNPGKSIHEYRLLGVTEAKLKELQAIEDKVAKNKQAEEKIAPVETKAAPQKAQPVVTKDATHRAIPQAKMYVPPPASEMAVLVEISTGKRTPMNRKHAERRARVSPKTFRVE
jgi:hypothetical protein